MNIFDLKIGDKLKVLVRNNSRGIKTLGDIIEITDIKKDGNNTLWIHHTPESFSGGGFRIGNEGAPNSYIMNKDVQFHDKFIEEIQCYKYLNELLQKLNIK